MFRFCSVCGSTVYCTAEGLGEGIVAVPVGAFAAPTFPVPIVSVYEERMHSWGRMPVDMDHWA